MYRSKTGKTDQAVNHHKSMIMNLMRVKHALILEKKSACVTTISNIRRMKYLAWQSFYWSILCNFGHPISKKSGTIREN